MSLTHRLFFRVIGYSAEKRACIIMSFDCEEDVLEELLQPGPAFGFFEELIHTAEKEGPLLPTVIGDPLDLDKPCVFAKPEALVGLLDEGGLGVVDRRVLNVLLSLSWPCFFQEGRLNVCGLDARRLMDAAGLGGQCDYRRLRASLERLKTQPVSLPGRIADGQCLLLAFELDAETGDLHLRFAPLLVAALTKPIPYARLDLRVAARLRSRWALILYEHLVQRERLKRPSWTLSFEALSELLTLGPGYAQWRHIERDLKAALKQVETTSGLVAELVVVERRGRRLPTKLCFKIRASAGTAPPAAGPVRKSSPLVL